MLVANDGESIDLAAYVPCGGCGSFVPRDTGCSHWKPGARAGAKRPGWVRKPPSADSMEVAERTIAVLQPGA